MSVLDHHGEWLSLLDVSGPFLAEAVLKEALPQGLQGVDPIVKKEVRQAYDEWREALDFEETDFSRLHDAWIFFVLNRALGYSADLLLAGAPGIDGYRFVVPESGVVLQPDAVLTDGKEGGRSLLLVKKYGADVALDEASKADGWAATPIERMIELCRATGTRLGLVTNGEKWTLVDAPVGAVTSTASWYAKLWSQEPLTLQAFVELLGIRRFFSGTEAELTTLLDKSLTLQDEVTDALGEQVRRAVEVLVQSLDRADQDRNRELLKDVSPEELYEAGLTIMMRIVFLLSAEERGLLLLGDPQYEANYAISTLRTQLRAEPEEVLERRWDAWSRLLAVFRCVFGGVDHGVMRMPALGGSLFDPDRFPFLEGRPKGSNWKTDPAVPLPIDNRTVLLLLEAVQLFQGRVLSYLALDVEQIGYVYEGLLERTVVRAKEPTLDLAATKNAKNPWVTLSELDDAAADGKEAIAELLKERTGSSASRIRNDLTKKADETEAGKLLAACDGDVILRDRVKPYFHLLRTDSWGYPLVYPKGTFMVASGSDRRETGTHYTPKSFTEAIVKTTLEPLVYSGPSEGLSRDAWRLKPPAQLLDLKICDPAMGSGAFLVQVCRYLGERVVEAWAEAERSGKAISSDGDVKDDLQASEPLSQNLDERAVAARRLIAERCLYGVDMNPLAVELAKLSIWLVTLAKGRPFGFLDHNLRCGDSLLGIINLEQLRVLDLRPRPESSKKLFASSIDEATDEAIRLRSSIKSRPIHDIRDVEVIEHLDDQARLVLRLPELTANGLVGAALETKGRIVDVTALSILVGDVLAGVPDAEERLSKRSQADLSVDLPRGKKTRKPLHWPLDFPEVFNTAQPGFDAFVGNPPFVGGQMLSGNFGESYQSYLVEFLSYDEKSSVDLVVFFFLRVFRLVRSGGYMGLLARRSIAEGKNRDAGLVQLIADGGTIYSARTNMEWPGKASVIVHQIHVCRDRWEGPKHLDGREVPTISAELGSTSFLKAQALTENMGRIFQGTILLGEGFKIPEATARDWIKSNPHYRQVVFPFVGGSEVNRQADVKSATWVINFWDWNEDKAKKFPLAYSLVERKVRPERDEDSSISWWAHLRPRPDMYHALGRGHSFHKHPVNWDKGQQPLRRVLVISTGVTKYPAFTFLSNDFIYSNKLCVLADERSSMFAVLSSDIHGVWAWSQKTSMGADLYSLVYAHGNIFETFPFPLRFLQVGDDALEQVGTLFFEARQEFMASSSKGLTKFYNEFHDTEKQSKELKHLRELQSEMNRRVAHAFGWIDLDVSCGFVEVGYLPPGSNVRFTIKERVRLEVLRRLNQLNQERQEQGGVVESQNDVGVPHFELEMVAEAPKRRRKRRQR